MRLPAWPLLKNLHDMHLAAILSNRHHHLSGKVEAPRDSGLSLIASVLEKPKTWVLAHPEYCPTSEELKKITQLQDRLGKGEPLPYILNYQEFFGLPFYVSPAVLIPRPETELLIEHALAWLQNHPGSRQAVDVGTGSGCIAIALAEAVTDLNMLAIDISYKALQVAQYNALINQVSGKVSFRQSDLLSNIDQSFDLICANLPYIPTSKLPDVNTLAFEPGLALDGGEDGMVSIRRLLSQCTSRLNTPALVLLEIEETTGQAALQAAHDTIPAAQIQLHQDLAGKDRLISISV